MQKVSDTSRSLKGKLTVPETEKPFVHLIKITESIEVCFTGKENVKPISLFLPWGRWNFSPSFATNLPSPDAIKLNNSCLEMQDININTPTQISRRKKEQKSKVAKEQTSVLPCISSWGIDTCSNSVSTTQLSLPPNCTLSTRKLVPPRSSA